MKQRERETFVGLLAGFGTIAEAHLGAWSTFDGVEIVAVADPVDERRKRAEALKPGIRTYAEIDRMLEAEKPDFTDICSPPRFHHEHLEAALNAGCHVLCEKPVFLSSAEHRSLQPVLQRAHRLVYPSHNYKFAPFAQSIQRAVSSGRLGHIAHGLSVVTRHGHARGNAAWASDWRRQRHIAGGGILTDHGTHNIYLATHFLGRPPIAVSCIGSRSGSGSKSEVEESALVTIDFDDARWHLTLTWNSKIRRTLLTVAGSNGVMTLDGDALECYDGDGNRSVDNVDSRFEDSSHQSWFRSMFEDFLAAVTAPHRWDKLLHEAMITTNVLEASYASMALGGEWQKVMVPPQKGLH